MNIIKKKAIIKEHWEEVGNCFSTAVCYEDSEIAEKKKCIGCRIRIDCILLGILLMLGRIEEHLESMNKKTNF